MICVCALEQEGGMPLHIKTVKSKQFFKKTTCVQKMAHKTITVPVVRFIIVRCSINKIFKMGEK